MLIRVRLASQPTGVYKGLVVCSPCTWPIHRFHSCLLVGRKGPLNTFVLFSHYSLTVMLHSTVPVLTLSMLVAAYASPLGPIRRQSITTLSTAQIEAFKPFTFFASTAYCNPSTTINWSCGGMFASVMSRILHYAG